MKKLLIILFFIPFILKGQLKTDNYYHASAGAIISGGMYTLGQFTEREMSPGAPALMAITAGFMKEGYDGFRGKNFSGRDFLVTSIAGMAVNYAMAKLWKKKKNKRKSIEFDNFDELGLIEK